MRQPGSNTIVPWVLCATPLVASYLHWLTVLKRSFHLYSTERLVSVAVVVYALTVWHTTDVGDELFYLNLVFCTIIAA
jgi:hypothetical protein